MKRQQPQKPLLTRLREQHNDWVDLAREAGEQADYETQAAALREVEDLFAQYQNAREAAGLRRLA